MTTPSVAKNAWQGLLLAAASLFVGFTQVASLLTPSDGSLPALEIRDHQVEVVIEDGYATTTVEHVFTNPHGRDLEAHYWGLWVLLSSGVIFDIH